MGAHPSSRKLNNLQCTCFSGHLSENEISPITLLHLSTFVEIITLLRRRTDPSGFGYTLFFLQERLIFGPGSNILKYFGNFSLKMFLIKRLLVQVFVLLFFYS